MNIARTAFIRRPLTDMDIDSISGIPCPLTEKVIDIILIIRRTGILRTYTKMNISNTSVIPRTLTEIYIDNIFRHNVFIN